MNRPLLLAENPAALDALSRIEVLYTDLDGTLLARGGSIVADSAGAPSTATIEAIVALNRAGLKVVPISGRTRLQLTEVVRLLGWTDFIGEVGSVLMRGAGPGRTVIYNTPEWPAHLLGGDATPYELIRDSGALEALRSAFPGRIEYHTPWHRDREASHLLRGCLDLPEAQDILDALELPVSLLDNGRVHPPTHGLACLEPIHAYHLVPRGVSKTQAIALDLAERGLSAGQAAAIGDSVTDLAMADSVALMALVDNAFESASVLDALAERPDERVVRLAGQRGDGWAEFAHTWLAARKR
jgi:hydroxymethylpyrimidine pyrophosphatase-like HAD family hydrolase